MWLPKCCCPDEVPEGEVLERKRKINCGNQVVKIEERKKELWEEKEKIVATKLPKLQGRIKKNNNNRNFGNQVSKNRRKKIYYGNQVAEIVGEEREKLLGILACQK